MSPNLELYTKYIYSSRIFSVVSSSERNYEYKNYSGGGIYFLNETSAFAPIALIIYQIYEEII
jgi:hypothetical protein